MSVSRQIYQRKNRKNWYCKVDGKEINLGPDKALAKKRWHEFCAEDQPGSLTTKALCKKYLKWVQTERAESSYLFAERALKNGAKGWLGFGRIYAKVPAKSIKPHHVTEWATDAFGDCKANTRRKYMVAVQRAFSWGFKQGYLNRNPLAALEKPEQEHGEWFVPVEDWPKLLEACSPSEFRELVLFTLLTGIRSFEVKRLKVKHVQSNRIVFPIQNSKGKKRNRIIHLSAQAKEVIERNSATGHVFRNSDGKPWTKDSTKCAMKRLKKATGWSWINLTVLRHSFAHAQVRSGTDSLILQSLMGHTDGRMLARVYAHADEASERLSEAANVTSHLLQTIAPSPTA